MSLPSTDRIAVSRVINAAVKGGWVLDYVNDYEEHLPVANKTEALNAVMAVDMAYLHVKRFERTKSGALDLQTGYVWFVLGNEPYEVAADYTINLEDALKGLFDEWEKEWSE